MLLFGGFCLCGDMLMSRSKAMERNFITWCGASMSPWPRTLHLGIVSVLYHFILFFFRIYFVSESVRFNSVTIFCSKVFNTEHRSMLLMGVMKYGQQDGQMCDPPVVPPLPPPGPPELPAPSSGSFEHHHHHHDGVMNEDHQR